MQKMNIRISSDRLFHTFGHITFKYFMMTLWFTFSIKKQGRVVNKCKLIWTFILLQWYSIIVSYCLHIILADLFCIFPVCILCLLVLHRVYCINIAWKLLAIILFALYFFQLINNLSFHHQRSSVEWSVQILLLIKHVRTFSVCNPT